MKKQKKNARHKCKLVNFLELQSEFEIQIVNYEFELLVKLLLSFNMHNTVCDLLLDFLTGRLQSVRITALISNNGMMNTGTPARMCP